MKPITFLLLPLLVATAAGAEGTTSSISFSDPSRSGEVRIHIGRGQVTVHGTDTAEVKVRSTLLPNDRQSQRKDGLRVISTSTGFSLSEKDNVIELSAGLDEGPGRGKPVEFTVEIPRSSSLAVINTWGGDIAVEKIDGNVEIKNLGGEIALTDVTGAALVETLNGNIEASFPALPAGKSLSFTSMNGEIQLRIPDNAKANVRFRTQNGNVLTDFSDDALVTQSEAMSPSAMEDMARAAGETARAAAETARAAAEAARQKLAEVAEQMARRREQADRKTEVERNTDRTNTSASANANASASANAAPKPPKAPKPPSIPALSGGKVVTGALNGGGTEIQVATMNGDIILRKYTP